MKYCVECGAEYHGYRDKCPECGCKEWEENKRGRRKRGLIVTASKYKYK